MPKRYKLVAGVSVDQARGVSTSRKATSIAETYIRQLTFEDGIEASVAVWPDGTVSVHVVRMNSGKVLHEWRRDKDATD